MNAALGMDWTPFISYIEEAYPSAMPYIRAIFIIIPVVGAVLSFVLKLLPKPSTVIGAISDDNLRGVLPEAWFTKIDKPTRFINNLIVVMNWWLATSIYRVFYHIVCYLAADFSKSKPNDVPTTISIPEAYDKPSDSDKKDK